MYFYDEYNMYVIGGKFSIMALSTTFVAYKSDEEYSVLWVVNKNDKKNLNFWNRQSIAPLYFGL